MGVIEFLCPITGEKQRFRFTAGEATPEGFYSARCTEEEVNAYEKAHPKAPRCRRHAHQGQAR